jgi:hypothetical protein
VSDAGLYLMRRLTETAYNSARCALRRPRNGDSRH